MDIGGSSCRSNWTPVLSGETATRAWQTVDAISDALLNRTQPANRRSGKPRFNYEDALLYGYLAAAKPEPLWITRAAEHLNNAIDHAQSLMPNLSLYGGLCGLGWTIEHLGYIGGGSDEEDDSNSDVDSAVLRALESGPWSGPYDLISGLVGFGVYFLERLPRESAAHGIRVVISQLETLSERAGNVITWRSRPDLLPEWQRKRCPDGYYNLGVAHGIPGVLFLLNEASESGLDDRARRMLERAMEWFLRQKRPPGGLSCFSPWLAPGESADCRLGWCYGDLGIAAVLLQITRRAGRPDWREFAEALLEHCLAWPMERSGINDAPLCHGAAGAAHIFNRIYQSEGGDRCRDTAIAWFEQTLAMWQTAAEIDEFGQSAPAFLDGSIGIALALLGGLAPIDPQWDRLLLLSGRA